VTVICVADFWTIRASVPPNAACSPAWGPVVSAVKSTPEIVIVLPFAPRSGVKPEGAGGLP
jgi:hypothetical protein